MRVCKTNKKCSIKKKCKQKCDENIFIIAMKSHKCCNFVSYLGGSSVPGDTARETELQTH